MFQLKKWLRDPINAVLVLFGVLAIIWPSIFLMPFFGILLAKPLYGWIFNKLDRRISKHPKLWGVLGSIFFVTIAWFFCVIMPQKLLHAWDTGVIQSFRRWGPYPIYSRIEDPVAYWLTFGTQLFLIVIFYAFALLMAYLLWTGRNSPIRRNKLLDTSPAMEPAPEEAEKYRRTIDLEEMGKP